LREVHRVLRPGGTAALSDFVPAAPFQPLAKAITGSPHLARFQYFGRCDLSFTISTYRRVLRDLGFQVLAERNITRNVQPTYMYLKKLLSHAAAIEGVTGTVVHFMDALRLAGALRLLNYYLIAFSKPDNVTPKR
jgi:SAM-dependent methyltransferase